MIPWLAPDDPFPPLSRALTHPNGLLAAGGDLSAERLVKAYSQGIFPWFSEGEPILWWSPDPRTVLFPAEIKISRSLAKRLRRDDFEVRVDTSFQAVMQACAEPRPGQNGTWIHQAMIDAYGELHRQGHAHCVEIWQGGCLVGGLYGVALGLAFFGESMFSRVTDASKIALVALARWLEAQGFGLVDCQMKTPHLASLGAREIPRRDFAERLGHLVVQPGIPGPWKFGAMIGEPA